MGKKHENFAFMAAMLAGLSGVYGVPNMFADVQPRTITHEGDERKYILFRKKREDETEEEYAAAWREEYKRRLQVDCAKKGLTVFEINGGSSLPRTSTRHKRDINTDTSNYGKTLQTSAT